MRLAIVLLALSACAPRNVSELAKTDPSLVRVCTSMYPAVIDAVRPIVAKAAPGARVEWEQGGSEPMRRRVEAGNHGCDVLLIADPWFYRTLAAEKKIIEYRSPAAARIPADARDPENRWVTARYSAMVLAVKGEREKGLAFLDLANEKRIAVAMGDPELSGTNLVTVTRLSHRYGWGFYESLRDKNAVVSLSNSELLAHLERGETDVAIVLLEVLLAARAKGSKVNVVVPKDGAIMIPGPIALLHDSPATRATYDAILSPEVQKAFVEKGWMYSSDPSLAAPAGAPTFDALLGGATLASIFAPVDDEAAVRARFAKLFARETAKN